MEIERLTLTVPRGSARSLKPLLLRIIENYVSRSYQGDEKTNEEALKTRRDSDIDAIRTANT